MQVPITWLRAYADLPADANEIISRLATIGFPVDAVMSRPTITGVVVGRITKIEKHPNADRLQVCTIDIGAERTLTIATAATNVDIQGFKFPPNLEVAKGTKVTWTNKDSTAHTVTSGTRPNKDGKFDGQVAAGGTFSFTFADAGVYQYFCSIHSSMNATITVK